jgi:hypothetical protein
LTICQGFFKYNCQLAARRQDRQATESPGEFDINFNLLYAVVDLREWASLTSIGDWDPIPNNINIGRVSHVGAPVPEPSTILLLGLGLVGLAGIGRKKIKS